MRGYITNMKVQRFLTLSYSVELGVKLTLFCVDSTTWMMFVYTSLSCRMEAAFKYNAIYLRHKIMGQKLLKSG